jgi:hypothetical protein
MTDSLADSGEQGRHYVEAVKDFSRYSQTTGTGEETLAP